MIEDVRITGRLFHSWSVGTPRLANAVSELIAAVYGFVLVIGIQFLMQTLGFFGFYVPWPLLSGRQVSPHQAEILGYLWGGVLLRLGLYELAGTNDVA